MQSITDTLVYLLAYLSLAGRDPDTGQIADHSRADDDCKALEYAGYLLDAAPTAERSVLRAAVERAIAREHAVEGPRHDWLAAYEDILTNLDERAASTDTRPA